MNTPRPVSAPAPTKGAKVRPGDLIRRRGNGPAGYVVRWPRDREDWTPLDDGSDEWVVTWFLNEGATGRDTDTELCCAAEFEVVGHIPGYDQGSPSPSFPVILDDALYRDLWRYFGDPVRAEAANAAGMWPTLPCSVRVNCCPGGAPALADTPFTRAFLSWRNSTP